ncbi:hypothetical protein ACL7TT_10140 [Microbulbifer sp. 2304DJ12-6]|uniref:hypothetical protein n=1 Tax=Microbulbifer sp. 2304DJ12-6 TaxID=3233340 RepID=UPI0039B0479E
MSNEESVANNVPRIYLINSLVVGLAIIIVLLVAGYSDWPFWPSVLLGGLAQGIFRIVKKAYMSSAKYPEREDEVYLDDDGSAFDWLTFNVFAMIFAFTSTVAAFWYGIGAIVGWLFSLV